MKTTISLFVLAASATVAFAESVPFSGGAGSGTRTNLTPTTITSDLLLDSTGGVFYRGAPLTATQTVHTVKAINTSSGTEVAGDINIAGGAQSNIFTIDVNSDTATTAISANSWTQNYLNVVVKNSNEAYATANTIIEFGNLFQLSATNVQTQTFTIDNIKGAVNAKQFDIGIANTTSGNSSTFTVSKTSDLTWRGITNIGKSGTASTYYANFNIDGKILLVDTTQRVGGWTLAKGSTVNISGTGQFLTANQAIDIKTGATMNSAGDLKLQGGGLLNLSGTLNITNTNPSAQFGIYKLITNGTFTQATASANNGVKLWRPATFNSGANWKIDERLDLQGNVVSGVDPSITTAEMTVNSGAHLVIDKQAGKMARVILWGLSNLILKQENAFADQNGNSIKLVIAADSKTFQYKPELHLYAEETFSNIVFANEVHLYLENELAKLILDNSYNDSNTLASITENNCLKIFNFSDNKIYIGEKEETLASVKYIQAFDSDNNAVALTVSNGWLTAVPEPAEWAAILSALALGFAAWRRRKA